MDLTKVTWLQYMCWTATRDVVSAQLIGNKKAVLRFKIGDAILEAMGWNRGDFLQFGVVETSVALKRVGEGFVLRNVTFKNGGERKSTTYAAADAPASLKQFLGLTDKKILTFKWEKEDEVLVLQRPLNWSFPKEK